MKLTKGSAKNIFIEFFRTVILQNTLRQISASVTVVKFRLLYSKKNCIICTACKVSKYRFFFWFVFSCIRTEYGDLRSTSTHSIQIQKNTDQTNSVFGHFSRSEWKPFQSDETCFLFYLKSSFRSPDI